MEAHSGCLKSRLKEKLRQSECRIWSLEGRKRRTRTDSWDGSLYEGQRLCLYQRGGAGGRCKRRNGYQRNSSLHDPEIRWGRPLQYHRSGHHHGTYAALFSGWDHLYHGQAAGTVLRASIPLRPQDKAGKAGDETEISGPWNHERKRRKTL